MGKRGPKSKGEYGDATHVLSTRITGELRKALEAAAAKPPYRTLSSEIEHRLRLSFGVEEKIETALGGWQLYSLLRMVATTMEQAGRHAFFMRHRKASTGVDWLNDPFAYDQVVKAIDAVLESLRPAGDATPPRIQTDDVAGGSIEHKRQVVESWNDLAAHFGEATARGVADLVSRAKPGLPLPSDRDSAKQKRARVIAVGLGPLTRRLSKKGTQS